jgi:hypothetical protein
MPCEESALFGGDERDEDRAQGPRTGGEHSRDRQEVGRSGGVVERTVVDRVAIHDGADAEVVPMRGEHQVLARGGGVTSRNAADHVVALEMLDAVREGHVERDPRVDRAEVARLGVAAKRGEVESGLAKERGGRRLGDPALEPESGRQAGLTRQHALFLGPTALHGCPAVAGALRVVDDQHACRAAALGLLELVGPAAIVGHRRAAEERGLIRGRWRVIHQHEEDLATHIHVLEVVPAELGRG